MSKSDTWDSHNNLGLGQVIQYLSINSNDDHVTSNLSYTDEFVAHHHLFIFDS